MWLSTENGQKQFEKSASSSNTNLLREAKTKVLHAGFLLLFNGQTWTIWLLNQNILFVWTLPSWSCCVRAEGVISECLRKKSVQLFFCFFLLFFFFPTSQERWDEDFCMISENEKCIREPTAEWHYYTSEMQHVPSEIVDIYTGTVKRFAVAIINKARIWIVRILYNLSSTEKPHPNSSPRASSVQCKAYSLPPDTRCVQNSLTIPFISIICAWVILQGKYFIQILFASILWCGFSWPFTFLLLLKSEKIGVSESAALCLVTAHGVIEDGICSALPNAGWHILRAQKTLMKLLSKCLQSKPCDPSRNEVTAR